MEKFQFPSRTCRPWPIWRPDFWPKNPTRTNTTRLRRVNTRAIRLPGWKTGRVRSARLGGDYFASLRMWMLPEVVVAETSRPPVPTAPESARRPRLETVNW